MLLRKDCIMKCFNMLPCVTFLSFAMGLVYIPGVFAIKQNYSGALKNKDFALAVDLASQELKKGNPVKLTAFLKNDVPDSIVYKLYASVLDYVDSIKEDSGERIGKSDFMDFFVKLSDKKLIHNCGLVKVTSRLLRLYLIITLINDAKFPYVYQQTFQPLFLTFLERSLNSHEVFEVTLEIAKSFIKDFCDREDVDPSILWLQSLGYNMLSMLVKKGDRPAFDVAQDVAREENQSLLRKAQDILKEYPNMPLYKSSVEDLTTSLKILKEALAHPGSGTVVHE